MHYGFADMAHPAVTYHGRRALPEVVVEGLESARQGRAPTLKGTSSTAPAGAVTAIGGSSGPGKTTVFSLIRCCGESDVGSIRPTGLPDGPDTEAGARGLPLRP